MEQIFATNSCNWGQMLYVPKYAFKESLWITTETSVAYLTTELTIGNKACGV